MHSVVLAPSNFASTTPEVLVLKCLLDGGAYVVALGYPSSSASLYRICEDLKKDEKSTASKRQLGRWQDEIEKSVARMKKYRHKFVSHIDQHAEDYVDEFNETKYSWEDLQEPLDDLACMLERLAAAAEGSDMPSNEEIRLRIFGASDYAIDAREHTAKFLADVQHYFPSD